MCVADSRISVFYFIFWGGFIWDFGGFIWDLGIFGGVLFWDFFESLEVLGGFIWDFGFFGEAF